MTVAERLKELRTQRQLSQNRLAVLAGMSPAQICQYESGRSAIGVQNLKKIAAALGCQMKDIDARCEEAVAERGANHNRYIGDDILREIVDSWRDLSAADKMEITAFVAAAKKRTPPPENSAKKDERFANRRVKKGN